MKRQCVYGNHRFVKCVHGVRLKTPTLKRSFERDFSANSSLPCRVTVHTIGRAAILRRWRLKSRPDFSLKRLPRPWRRDLNRLGTCSRMGLRTFCDESAAQGPVPTNLDRDRRSRKRRSGKRPHTVPRPETSASRRKSVGTLSAEDTSCPWVFR